MKFFYCIIFSLFLFTCILFPQSQWTEIHSFTRNVSGILIQSGKIYAGLDHRNLFKSEDGGIIWDTLDVSDVICISADNRRNIFVGREASVVSFSSDSGSTWNNVNIPIYSIWGFLFHSSGQILAGGYGGVIVSNDSGYTWQLQKEGLPNFGVKCFIELNDGSVLASVNTQGLYKRNFGDTSWVKIVNSPPGGDVAAFVQNSQNVIYAGCNQGLYKSEDSGDTWMEIDSLQYITSLCVDNNNNIYCGCAFNGVFRITNNSLLDSLNYNLVDTDVRSLFYTNDGALYCGTYSGTLNKLSITPTSVNLNNNTPIFFELHQNYPNPFNPVTTIEYSIPWANYVSINVYNSIGQKISTLINKYQTSGHYKVTFGGNKLSSGVYIYKLVSGGYSITKKMSFIK